MAGLVPLRDELLDGGVDPRDFRWMDWNRLYGDCVVGDVNCLQVMLPFIVGVWFACHFSPGVSRKPLPEPSRCRQ